MFLNSYIFKYLIKAKSNEYILVSQEQTLIFIHIYSCGLILPFALWVLYVILAGPF